jgi:hypothetical protein
MSFPEDEIKYLLLQLDDRRRGIRIVHVPTGISVEDDGTSSAPIIARRLALLQELAETLERRAPTPT